MQKLTVNDFSGGIQESTIPDDFSDRQWAQLKGFIPASETMFETQWAQQRIGAASTFQSVYPLESSIGTFLVAIKTDGTVWWCKAPALDATYSTTGAVSWTQITDVSNVGYAASGTQPGIKVHPNPYYKFLCSVPFETQKFVRTPKTGSEGKVYLDIDNAGLSKGLSSGVLINTAERPDAVAFTAFNQSGTAVSLTVAKGHNLVVGQSVRISHANVSAPYVSMVGVFTIVSISVGAGANPDGIVFTSPVSDTVTAALNGTITSQAQALVAFVDTTSTGSVKVASFPNVRRLPVHGETGNFINGTYLDSNDASQTSAAPAWPMTLSPEMYMHPYTYIDQYGTLLPGTGIVPRGNIGVMKAGRLLLGDIEWRTKYAVTGSVSDSQNCTASDGTTSFGVFSTVLSLPGGFLSTARTLYNNGEGVLYLKGRATTATAITLPTYANGVYTTRIIAKRMLSATSARLYFSAAHNLTTNDKIEVFNIDGTYNGLRTITAINTADVTGNNNIDITITNGTLQASPTYLVYNPSKTVLSGTTATIDTLTAHGVVAGVTIQLMNAGFPYDGTWTVATAPTTTQLTFTYGSAPGDLASASLTVSDTSYPRIVSYDYRVEVGAYQTIPNAPSSSDTWYFIMAAASASNTTVLATQSLNMATHALNDQTTGPYRGGMYFSTGDIDTFDPRAMLFPAKSDVRMVGLHVLDDTIIVITQKGSAGDGLLRIRGYLNRLISYSGTSDPNAVRIEVVRGGLGASQRTSKYQRNYSCVWPAAGVVTFVDSEGGIYYTNGQSCDRFDRFGPKSPNPTLVSDLDHVAAMGKHLFAYRHQGGSGAQRLLCFTILSSGDNNGAGCWTEVVIPGEITNMVGSDTALYYIYSGGVYRMAPGGPSAERGKIHNVNITQTVSTRTFGEAGSHRRINWHRFGMTFNVPTTDGCTVGTVQVQGTGALSIGTLNEAGSNDPVKYTTTLNRAYSTPSVLGEFIVPAGIGPQAVASATVTFTGYVQLQSASFWITGSESRDGDK